MSVKNDGVEEREDQILEGIQKIAQYAEGQAKTAKDSIAKVEARVDGFETSQAKLAERMEKKNDETVSIISDKLARIEKRQQATGRLSIIETSDVILSAIDDADRRVVRLMESTMQETRDKGQFANPIFKAGSALWFMYAMKLQLPGRFGQTRDADSRKLDRLIEAFGGDTTKNVLVEGTDALGGYTVPKPVEAELMRLIEDNSVMRPLVTKIPMDSKTLAIPKKGSSITATVVAENVTMTDSIPALPFAQLLLTAKKIAGVAVASIEDLQDSAIGLMGYIQTAIAEAIGQVEDREALDGESTFIGLAGDTEVNEVVAAGADGDVINFAKLVSIVFKSRQRAGRIGARWYMAPEAMAKVTGLRSDSIQAADGLGLPIFQWANVPGAIAPTLLGFPIEVVSTISIAQAKGNASTLTNIYFGPPNAIVFGDRQGMAWEVSNAPNWGKYLIDMRLVKRTGIGVAVPTAMTRAIDLITA